MVTIFKNIFDKDNSHFIKVDNALERIRTGKSKTLIDSIRNGADKGEKNKAKRNLPSICFSGTFSERADDKMIDHSGYVVLDWDDVENVEETKAEISKDKYTYAVWVSPSGTGLKALVKIPKEKENHRAYYLGLIEKYPSLDVSNKNESRVCYESYDPEIFINKDSEVWEEKGTEQTDDFEFVPLETVINNNEPYLKKSLENAFERGKEMVSNAAAGTRHERLLASATLLGGYLHYGSFSSHDIEVALANEFSKTPFEKHYDYKKTILDGIRNGDRKPLYIDIPLNGNNPQNTIPQATPKAEYNQLISKREDEAEWLDLARKNKIPQGLDLGSEEFDKHFRLKRKTMVGIFGIDNVGKSTIYFFLALGYAKRHDLRFLMICKENEDSDIRQSLIELYLGQSYHLVTDKRAKEAEDFVYKHFDIVYQDSGINKDNLFTMLDVLFAKKDYFAVFLDPYNAIQYEQTPKSNYTFLDELRRYQIKHNTSFHISMHISTDKARNNIYTPNDSLEVFEGANIPLNGQMKIPRKNFVEGGQPIANKLDDILIVHRVMKLEEVKNYTMVAVEKVKVNRTGGMVTFEHPVLFKKVDGYMSFIDRNEVNPITVEGYEEPMKEPEKPLPNIQPKDAFDDFETNDEGSLIPF